MTAKTLLAKLRRNRWTAWVGSALFIVLVFIGVRAFQDIGLPPYPAPVLAGILLDGTEYKLEGQPAGTRLIYFWASWCPICTAHQGTMDALMRRHDVITVATKSGSDAEVQQHLLQAGLHWRVLNDPQGAMAQAWKARGVPTIFVVDRRGQVRFRMTGYTSGIEVRARLWFADNF